VTHTFAMALRTGNWGPLLYELAPHSQAVVELAPANQPGVLVRIIEGLPAVPRELVAADVVEMVVTTPSGKARLRLAPPTGTAESQPGRSGEGSWELWVECTGQRSLHLYSRPGTPFPTDAELEALASVVVPAR
jgi:hypothetical protein